MADLSFPYGVGSREVKQKKTVVRQSWPNFGTRQYAAGKSSRLTADWNPSNTSSDTELVGSLTTLRARSRQLIRDASYAKRAKVVVVNNVIGTGIGIQAQVMNSRGVLNERVNGDIEEAFREWCEAENCHTGGRLAFKDLERMAMSQVFEAGEVFFRKHFQPFGSMGVPYALELIEAERIADEYMSPYLSATSGNEIRMGIEVDRFHKPVAYWIRKRHPGEFRFSTDTPDMVERVPADQIIHLATVDRWPQTRGEPWLHAAARRLNDMDGYAEAEIVRARAEASMSGAIETPEDAESFGELQPDGSYEMETEAGVFKRLNPGEKLAIPARTSPNSAMDPFMRLMLREVASGVGVSYESVSRDYSQSNYSSSRLALLDDRDLWRVLQSWFASSFRVTVHREWLQQAVLSGKIPSISSLQYALAPRKFAAVAFKPRGWSWIDPTKEVAAFKEAVRCGFTTVTDVIAQTGAGLDIEDVLNTRERELKLMAEKGLEFETDPMKFDSGGSEQAEPQKPPADPPDTPKADLEDPPTRRVSSFWRK